MNYPKVVIIILNWNGWQDTIKCLKSLREITYPEYFILLYDNGSTDESVEKILPYIDSSIRFVQLGYNYGFTKSCNVGMKTAFDDLNADWVLLLNNDTIVTPNFLDEMIKKSDCNIGMIQPLLLRMDNHSIIDTAGHILRWGQIYDRGIGEINVNQYRSADNLVGASAAAGLYRREMIEDIGLFDESYFSGYEDSELSWRAYKRGWKTGYSSEAIIYHKRSASLNHLLHNDLQFASKFRSDATRPCKTHGTIIDRCVWMLPYAWIGTKRSIGKLLGRNNEGGMNDFKTMMEMLK